MLEVPKKMGTYGGDIILGNLLNCGEVLVSFNY